MLHKNQNLPIVQDSTNSVCDINVLQDATKIVYNKKVLRHNP